MIPQSAETRRWIVAVPRDRRRERFQLFVPDEHGRLIAFAKFTRNPQSDLMVRIRRRLAEVKPVSFVTPSPIGEGTIEGWWYSVDVALPPGFHRPAPLSPMERRGIVQEFQDLFADLVPASDRVVHGDFGPWNVRRGGGEPVIVLDWEEVTNGPDAADELWHELNSVLIRRPRRREVSSDLRLSLRHHAKETVVTAASFWLEHLDRPEAAEIGGMPEIAGSGARLLSGQRQVLQDLVQR